MAFLTSKGEQVTHACPKLLDELKADLKEFGANEPITVWCKRIKGVEVYTNYDFNEPEAPITKDELVKGEYFKTMSIGELLPLIEKENQF